MQEGVKQNLRVFHDVLSLITGLWPTPLVRLKSLSDSEYDVWAKLEFFNALSHSIKDRPVWYMIKKAAEEGRLGKVLYEASSGNVAIAMALLSNILGVKARLFVPKPTPRTTETLLKIIGAEVIRTDFQTIDRDFVEYVKERAAEDGATNLNQFENDRNPESHYLYTAREIDTQLNAVGRSPPKAIVCGVGTSGHIAAISKYFKSKYEGRVLIVGAVPARGDVIPGIKRPETGPKWLPEAEVNYIIDVRTEDAAREVVNIARSEGLLVGLSAGAVVSAFRKVRGELGAGTYVLVFPDDIFKYVEYVGKYVSIGKHEEQ